MLTNAAGSKNSNRGKAAASDEFSPVEAFVPRQTLSAYSAWGSYQLIGQKGVIYPDHFDAEYEALKFAKVAAFSTMVSFITAAIFVCVGGFRLWKSGSNMARRDLSAPAP